MPWSRWYRSGMNRTWPFSALAVRYMRKMGSGFLRKMVEVLPLARTWSKRAAVVGLAGSLAMSILPRSSGFCTRMQPWLKARWALSNSDLLGVSCR